MSSPITIELDATNTAITFRVDWFGFVGVTGRFAGVAGGLCLPDPATLEGATMSLAVEAATVDTGVALRDAHLKGPRFLDAEQHRQIRFESSHIAIRDGILFVAGTLTLKGQSAQVVANCPLSEAPDRGNVTLCGELAVSRSQYGIGAPRGAALLTPLLAAIGDRVQIRVAVSAPAEVLRSPLSLVLAR